MTLPSLILAAILSYQRHLIFSKGNYGPLSGDSLVLLVWAVAGLVLLLATKPWKPVSRMGSAIRWMGVNLALGTILFMLVVTSGWGRWRLLRMEALLLDLGITYPHQKGRKNLTLEIGASDVGPYILEDRQLRRFMMEKTGADFLTQPTAAGRVLEHERKSRSLSFEDIWALEQGPEFLLACLVSQVGHHKDNLLSAEESRRVLNRFLTHLKNQDREVTENLVYLVMTSSLFQESEVEAVMGAWAGRFEDLESLAVEGLITRREVQSFVTARQPLRVKVEVTGALPGAYEYRQLDRLLTESALGLVRSCGLALEQVTESPDLLIRVHMAEIAHHEYQQPTYDYETYYVDRYYTVGKPYTFRTRKVAQQRRISTGSETKVAYAPTVSVTFRQDGRTLELPTCLIFWHHLRYDYENHRFKDLTNEKTYGRMWPFGVAKRKMEFPHANDK